MKNCLTVAFVLLSFGKLTAQNKQCYCDKDTLMNDATANCKTVTLKNKSTLYWQFNCDRIWLTLENINGEKVVIDEVPVKYYPYSYRLGFQLVKENKRTILFKSGCSANGSCNYTLIDKSTGKKVKTKLD